MGRRTAGALGDLTAPQHNLAVAKYQFSDIPSQQSVGGAHNSRQRDYYSILESMLRTGHKRPKTAHEWFERLSYAGAWVLALVALLILAFWLLSGPL